MTKTEFENLKVGDSIYCYIDTFFESVKYTIESIHPTYIIGMNGKVKMLSNCYKDYYLNADLAELHHMKKTCKKYEVELNEINHKKDRLESTLLEYKNKMKEKYLKKYPDELII